MTNCAIFARPWLPRNNAFPANLSNQLRRLVCSRDANRYRHARTYSPRVKCDCGTLRDETIIRHA